jgi:hypothetical protein
MWRSVSVSFTQPGLRSALLLALVLAILPSPPPASSPVAPRGAVDVVRALAGVYRKRSANQRVNGGGPVCGDVLGERGVDAGR